MIISKLQHPHERIGLIFSAALLLIAGVFFPKTSLIVLGSYGLLLWLLKRSTEKENLYIKNEEEKKWEELGTQYARKLGLMQKPPILAINPDQWKHRLGMIALRGQYLFLDQQKLEKSPGEKEWQLARQLGHFAAGHGAWWRKLLSFPIRLFPLISSLMGKTENHTADLIAKYCLEAIPDSAELKAGKSYKGNDTAILLSILADAWSEVAIPWISKGLGPLYASYSSNEERIEFLSSFDLEAAKSLTPRPGHEAKTSFVNTQTQKSNINTQDHISMSSSKKINPVLSGLIGFLLGLPLSYFFQSETLRAKLSIGNYLAELPNIFEKAGRSDDYMGIIVTVVISCVLFGFAGVLVSYFANRR